MGAHTYFRLVAANVGVRVPTQEHFSWSSRRAWPALAVLVLVVTAVNTSHYFAPRGSFSQPSPKELRPNHPQLDVAPFRCPFSAADALGAKWLPTCYSPVDTSAAVLDPSILQMLQERRDHSQRISDWLQLGNSSRSVLQCTFFSIPKVAHMVWVGKAPQPTQLLDTWRVDYLRYCPGWTHKLWTDDNISELKHLDRSFLDKEDSYNGKSDILRTAILYEHGGVYIDADTQWVNNKCLDNILLFASDTGIFAATEPGKEFVASGVVGAVPHHPIVRLYQQVQVLLSTDGRQGAPWERLGPLAINGAMRVADNHASSRHCTPNTAGRLTLPQSYYNEDMPAATSLLTTIINSRYFYPAHWLTKDKQLTNLTYVAQLVKEKYPDAAMYQLGFTTNGISTGGAN